MTPNWVRHIVAENDGEVLKRTSRERCVSQLQLALLQQVLVFGWGKVLEVLGMNKPAATEQTFSSQH